MNILLVDDEEQLTDAISSVLKKNNYVVEIAHNGQEGLDFAIYGNYDLIILDIMMPVKTGLVMLSELRKKSISTPVLLLSAKSETYDKVGGLNLGADDYLTKPFSTDELLARINALLRRQQTYVDDSLTIGNTTLNRTNHSLIVGEGKVLLGKKEYAIMEILMRNPTTIISKDTLMDKVWGYNNDAEYNAIEVYISFLRKKLSALSSNITIKAYRGTGYRIDEEE